MLNREFYGDRFFRCIVVFDTPLDLTDFDEPSEIKNENKKEPKKNEKPLKRTSVQKGTTSTDTEIPNNTQRTSSSNSPPSKKQRKISDGDEGMDIDKTTVTNDKTPSPLKKQSKQVVIVTPPSSAVTKESTETISDTPTTPATTMTSDKDSPMKQQPRLSKANVKRLNSENLENGQSYDYSSSEDLFQSDKVTLKNNTEDLFNTLFAETEKDKDKDTGTTSKSKTTDSQSMELAITDVEEPDEEGTNSERKIIKEKDKEPQPTTSSKAFEDLIDDDDDDDDIVEVNQEKELITVIADDSLDMDICGALEKSDNQSTTSKTSETSKVTTTKTRAEVKEPKSTASFTNSASLGIYIAENMLEELGC